MDKKQGIVSPADDMHFLSANDVVELLEILLLGQITDKQVLLAQISERLSLDVTKARLLFDTVQKMIRLSIGSYYSDAEFSVPMFDAVLLRFRLRLFPPVTSMEIIITEKCPLRCKYCWVNHEPRTMSDGIATMAVDLLIRESRDRKDLSVLLFGGEPLCEFDALRQIVKYAQSVSQENNKNLTFSMTTNAVLLDEENMMFMRDNNLRYLVSIDGDETSNDSNRIYENGSGTYRKIVSMIPLMKKYQPWLGARMTVSPHLADRVASNYEHLTRIGFNQVLISPVEGVLWQQEEMDRYSEEIVKVIEIYKKYKNAGYKIRLNTADKIECDRMDIMTGVWGCKAGRMSIAVAPDGRIIPCSKMLYPSQLADKSCLGHVKYGITNIKKRMLFNGLIPIERKQCEECKYTNSCTGGCYATNYWENGDIFKPGAKSTCIYGPQGEYIRELYKESTRNSDSEDDVPQNA